MSRVAALLTAVAVLVGTQFVFVPAASAQGFVPISGAGSTWSSNAVEQWVRNVAQYGIKVNYAGTGSSDGRNQFKNGTVDFAVSEIEYGLTDNGVTDRPPDRRFGYMPIVAGGTAFMYNLKIGANRVTNLRLSGDVLAKIFTQQITKWDDAAIKADNPGLALPAKKIIPVVRSDGSGTTAQFTRWLAARHTGTWDAWCVKAGRTVKPCGFTSVYPTTNGMESKPQSQGVTGYVKQNSSEGAITYVEYSYAMSADLPVAKVLNDAGYYVEPKASSVAVALLKAGIREDFTQDLGGVYTDRDKRTYPLSSYSYMILPKEEKQPFTKDKGRTLSEFAYYFLCEGQQQAELLGYSPLPVNLVQAGVDQVAQIPGTTNKLNRNALQRCNNPTFSPDGTNLLAKNAPQPPECDRKGGPAQCTTGTGGAPAPTHTTGGGAGGGGAGGGGAGGGGAGGGVGGGGVGGVGGGGAGGGGVGGGVGGGGGGGGTGSDGTGSVAAIDPATGAPLIDPDTGLAIDASGSQQGTGLSAYAVPVAVALPEDRLRVLLAVIAAGLLLALVLGPPLLARHMRRQGDAE